MRTIACLVAVTLSGCEGCSSRQQDDLRSLAELQAALGHYAPSWDAGVADFERLQRELAPTIEVTPAWVEQSAQVTPRERSRSERGVRGLEVVPAQRAAFLDALAAKQGSFERLRWTDGGVAVELATFDLASVAAKPWPVFAPAGAWPCVGACAERERALLEGSALLTRFSGSLDGLRVLKGLERDVRDARAHLVPPGLQPALRSMLERPFPEGTTVTFSDGALRVCGAQVPLAECASVFGLDVVCELAPLCGAGTPCTDPASSQCGVRLSPAAR